MELDSHKSVNQVLKMISELITLVIQPIREGGNLLAIIIIVIKGVITQRWLLFAGGVFDRGRHSRVVCDVTGRPAVARIPSGIFAGEENLTQMENSSYKILY